MTIIERISAWSRINGVFVATATVFGTFGAGAGYLIGHRRGVASVHVPPPPAVEQTSGLTWYMLNDVSRQDQITGYLHALGGARRVTLTLPQPGCREGAPPAVITVEDPVGPIDVGANGSGASTEHKQAGGSETTALKLTPPAVVTPLPRWSLGVSEPLGEKLRLPMVSGGIRVVGPAWVTGQLDLDHRLVLVGAMATF